MTGNQREYYLSKMTVGARLLVPMYGTTLVISAALLFWIQPLFGKLTLPLLGGSPSVWNVLLLFFQTMLLAGYAYAHLLCRLKLFIWQALIHSIVLLAAFITLPIVVAGAPPAEGVPILWLLGELTVRIGLPFFAIAATAPLLQRWFTFSRHYHAHDPYFLYGLSNLGSISALIAYPFLFEPFLGLHDQSLIWTVAFGVLLVAIMACCGQVLLTGTKIDRAEEIISTVSVTWRQRLRWIALAFAPSSLLLGVTTQLTTDVASVPLLWVVPLALYLITFVIVFSRRRLIPHAWIIRVQPIVLVIAIVSTNLTDSILILCATHLTIFFIVSLVCHGELVRLRPPAGGLTEFYLAMGIGGALGGFFNAIVAPVLFVGVYEYGLAIVVACLLRPHAATHRSLQYFLDVALPAGLLAIIVLTMVSDFGLRYADDGIFSAGILTVLALVVLSFRTRPIRFGLGIGAVLICIGQYGVDHDILAQQRSFFGIHRVEARDEGRVRFLIHGTTLHGYQDLRRGQASQPQGYYSRVGPLGQVFTGLLAHHRLPNQVGLVGLGAGASLCHGRAPQSWTVFEIDPAVVKIAQDASLLSYWSECAGRMSTQVQIGDARLTLGQEDDHRFDLLILDAYNSDAIPVHLLTVEAFHLYLRKIKPGGLLLLHLTNRHLDLESVFAAITGQMNLPSLIQNHQDASWAALSTDEGSLAFLAVDARWRSPKVENGVRPWTDDYSNILSILK